MVDFWKSRRGFLIAVCFVAGVAATYGWMREMRSAARQEQETKARIQNEVKQSIEKATSGFKLCPLSDPDCNKR